jgi:hypothetical protein
VAPATAVHARVAFALPPVTVRPVGADGAAGTGTEVALGDCGDEPAMFVAAIV